MLGLPAMSIPPVAIDANGVSPRNASNGSRERIPDEGNDETGEWDYEYDDQETEDFYFTLDITAHQTVPMSHETSRGGRSRKRPRKTSPSANDAESTTPVPTDNADPGDNADDDNDNDDVDKADTEEEGKTLQILDLHTTNPLIKIDDTFYSCSWATPLGTQVYLTPTETAAVPNPLRPGYKVDMVALSRARLQARPLTLVPRRPSQIHGSTAADAITLDDDENDDSEEHVDGSDTVSQPTFLARLAAIKRKRGETDEVPLTGMKDISTDLSNV